MEKLKIKNSLVNNRESIKLEFKKTFQKTQKEYIKTICAFANNQGGKIVFGVENNPRKPIGLEGKKYQDFNEYDSKDLSQQIQNYLSENIKTDFYEFSQEIDGKIYVFGVLEVFEADTKPIVCTTSDEGKKLREGAIYYRYNGESKEIKSSDLIRLIQNEKEKEKKLFLDHISKINKYGVKNIGIFNYDGELFAGDKKVIIDKNILDKIKFIKEGNFVEKEGAPALILKGEIKDINGVEIITKISDPNKTHPYEGLNLIEEEILKSKEINFSERKYSQNYVKKYARNGIFVKSKNKTFSIKYILNLIKKKYNFIDNIDYCWHNEKNSVIKYSEKYLNECIKIIKDEEKVENLFIV